MKNSFKGFIEYVEEPNTISCGTLFTKEIDIPFAVERKRTLRVWLPEDYDGKKKFPVFYFTDGQNLVDQYTSGYGEWEMDERIHEFINSGHQGIILVGIDCNMDPEARESEYRPHLGKKPLFMKIKHQYPDYAEQFADYIVKEIKPLVDKTFLTKKEKENTGFGGSSMGGLFSFFICERYPEIFSMCLSFSPAFFFFNKKASRKYLKTLTINDVKVAFYCGKQGKLESALYRYTIYFYKTLIKFGYDKNKLLLLIDKSEKHHESAWTKYVIPSLEFLLK